MENDSKENPGIRASKNKVRVFLHLYMSQGVDKNGRLGDDASVPSMTHFTFCSAVI